MMCIISQKAVDLSAAIEVLVQRETLGYDDDGDGDDGDDDDADDNEDDDDDGDDVDVDSIA